MFLKISGSGPIADATPSPSSSEFHISGSNSDADLASINDLVSPDFSDQNLADLNRCISYFFWSRVSSSRKWQRVNW